MFNNADFESLIFKKPGPAISISEKQNKNTISKSRIKLNKLDEDPSGTKFERMQFYLDKTCTECVNLIYPNNTISKPI